MKLFLKILLCLLITAGLFNADAQEVEVDVNLNIEHSVDGVSDFGRERRMTIHAASHESDWNGHEDMLDYLINDLDVYFGRETGSATWKMFNVEEDPDKLGWANEAQMMEHGAGLNKWYSSSDFAQRRQFEKKGDMIMGINDFSPMYPNLSWYPGFGKGADGWFVRDTDAAADWVAKYMKHYFAQSEGEEGPALPKYWEAYNEPDMNFMNTGFGMIVSSLEKNWEYHKRVAQEVRSALGDKAPLIGGMTWGQLDLFRPDGNFRTDGKFWYDNSSEEARLLYDNMLSGVGSGIPNPGIGNGVWPKAWDNRTDQWWQWDFMYQGFIDYAGADMDFYGVHMYDWPNANPTTAKANTRAGGHTEAFLDMFEWYDTHLFGDKKDIVLSEFGAVNGNYILSLPNGERDWPFLKSFNQLQMQFLERPSHVVYSMPFAPTKAVWGAHFEGNNVVRYEGATLMEPRGSWTGDPNTWTINEPTEGWGWSKILYFFELWKGVDGTRIDTKSTDNDVQVDAYVLNDHAYLILNNAQDFPKTLNLNFFGDDGNTVSTVEFRHLYEGDDNIPVLTTSQMTGAPSHVTLKPNATIVLDYTFASNVTINAESKESKYMCDPLAGDAVNKRGTQLCHTSPQSSITATINSVVKPIQGEAIIRIGGFFANPSDGTLADGSRGLKVKKLKVNGNDVIVDSDNFVANTRGYGVGSWAGSWFGVVELECPVEYLVDGENTVFFERWQGVQFTTAMIQVFDMSEMPERTTSGSVLTGITFDTSEKDVMMGETLGLVPIYSPVDASGKALTWSSSNSSAITVDENGIVKAIASTGSATITATNVANGAISAIITINAVPYEADEVTGITINEGESITVDQFLNTKLNVTLSPEPDVAPKIIWTTSDESIVEIVSPGTIMGKGLGQTTRITATVEGTELSDSIDVTVNLNGGETISGNLLPEFITPLTEYTFNIPVAIMGERTVMVELLNVDEVIGTNEQTVDAIGNATASVTINLASEPEIADGYRIRLILKNGSEVLDTRTFEVEMRAAILVTGVTLTSGPIDLVKQLTKTLSATVAPADASDRRVTWSSSDPTIVEVNQSGKVTAIDLGEALITVITVDQSKQATVTINVIEFNGTLVIEAEDFTTTGGPFDGWQKSESAINHNQSGDWGDYKVNFPVAGEYSVKYYIGVPDSNQDGAVKIYLDGNLQSTTDLTPTGDWDAYQAFEAPSKINVTAGEHTIRVESAGPQEWQWNMDKFELSIAGSASVEGVVVSPESITVGVGQVRDLSASVLPQNASDKSVVWSSANESVVTVDAITGAITGVAVGAAVVTATSNDGGFTGHCTVTVQEEDINVLISEITIVPATFNLALQAEFQLKATISPENADDQSLTWTSSNTAVATVNSTTGIVSGVAEGEATITAMANDASGKSATSVVTVVSSVPISLEFDDRDKYLNATYQVGGEIQVSCNFNAGTGNVLDATGVTFWFRQVQADWAGITKDIKVSDVSAAGKSSGTATATISLEDVAVSSEIGTDFYFLWLTITPQDGTQYGIPAGISPIIVVAPSEISVTGVSLSQSTATVTKGETISLAATIAPSNAFNKSVTWESSNEAIALVNETGTVTAVAEGSATVAVKTIDGGFEAICSITVTEEVVEVTEISLSQTSATLDVGETISLNASFSPANASNKNVSWTSSDESVTTVSDGVVTAIASGTATIKATTEDGAKEATCTVTVNPEVIDVTNVILGIASISIDMGERFTFEATVLPENATDKSIIWESSNASIATVIDGEVTSVAPGETNITASAHNEIKASTLVTVKGDDSNILSLVEVNELSVYPVPTSHFVSFEGLKEGEYRIVIFDLLGVEHFNEIMLVKPDDRLDVSEFVNGIYFIQLEIDESIFKQKIVIRH